ETGAPLKRGGVFLSPGTCAVPVNGNGVWQVDSVPPGIYYSTVGPLGLRHHEGVFVTMLGGDTLDFTLTVRAGSPIEDCLEIGSCRRRLVVDSAAATGMPESERLLGAALRVAMELARVEAGASL